MKYAIVGNGGLSSELKAYIDHSMKVEYATYVSDEYHTGKDDYKNNIFTISDLIYEINNNPLSTKVIIAVSDTNLRERFVLELPKTTQYFTYIHPSATIYSKKSIGHGCIIAPNAVITTNVSIGNHCLINYNVSIGHDTTINDYCTFNPGVAISGNCKINKNCFFGAKSSIREKTSVANNTTIGMGAVIVKDITNSNNTFIGVPGRKLNKG